MVKIVSLLISLAFAFAYSSRSMEIYYHHQTRGDLTSFAQATWNSTQGRSMQNTFNYSVHNFWGDRNAIIPADSNIFGIHLNPILYLFVPIYSLRPHPTTLLLIQSILTALAGYLFFLISSYLLKNQPVSLLIQISLLSYFATVSAVLSEFHAFTLSIFFASLFIYFYIKQKFWAYYPTLILFFFVQENTALATIFFGLYLIFFTKRKLHGLITTILSITYFFLAIKLIIPFFSNYPAYIFESAYGNPLGNNLSEIVINSIIHPDILIKQIFSPENLNYLLKLLIPLSPLVIFSPASFLVAIASLTTNLISSSSPLKSQLMHYESIAVPFLFFSLVLGIKFFHRLPKIVPILILTAFTLFGYKKFTSLRLNPHLIFFHEYTSLDQKIDQIITLIPPNTSVTTQDYLSGHLTNRRFLYLFPVYSEKSDYVFIANKQSTWPLSTEEHHQIISQLLATKNFQTVFQDNDFYLFKNLRSPMLGF
ncbi:MAG: DUF2079 domain-containing protein [Patescibacteria group bacterium]